MSFKTDGKAFATAWGKEMLKKHFPPKAGWDIRVWENGGWHVEFTHGEYVHVYYCMRSKKFWCLLGSDHGGGKPEWTPGIPYRCKDPVQVVQRTLGLARMSLRIEIERYNQTSDGICREKLSLKGECV